MAQHYQSIDREVKAVLRSKGHKGADVFLVRKRWERNHQAMEKGNKDRDLENRCIQGVGVKRREISGEEAVRGIRVNTQGHIAKESLTLKTDSITVPWKSKQQFWSRTMGNVEYMAPVTRWGQRHGHRVNKHMWDFHHGAWEDIGFETLAAHLQESHEKSPWLIIFLIMTLLTLCHSKCVEEECFNSYYLSSITAFNVISIVPNMW